MLKFSFAPTPSNVLRPQAEDASLCLPQPRAPRIRKEPECLLLYYISDRKQFPGDSREQEARLLEKISECAAAGVDFIQLREKDLSTRDLEQLAQKARTAIPSGSASRLLINSRIDVAIASGAHGVHLPANGLSPNEARSIFVGVGISYPLIAVSTHSQAQVAFAESQGADFAVFGPVFEKGAFINRGGLEQLAALTLRVESAEPPISVLALGGITPENSLRCIDAGAAGIAGIRIFQENDVASIVSRVRAATKAARDPRS